jgi:hypothetical protein
MALLNPFKKFAALRVGACATSSQRVFTAFGGPQGHGDSLPAWVMERAG